MPLASYEELRKVDIKKYCKKRDGLDYLNWATCINLLRMHGADKVYWEPVPDPVTGSSLRKTDVEFSDKNGNKNRCYETLIKVVIDENTYFMQTPVMNGSNPVKDNSMTQQRVWNSMCRAFVAERREPQRTIHSGNIKETCIRCKNQNNQANMYKSWCRWRCLGCWQWKDLGRTNRGRSSHDAQCIETEVW